MLRRLLVRFPGRGQAILIAASVVFSQSTHASAMTVVTLRKKWFQVSDAFSMRFSFFWDVNAGCLPTFRDNLSVPCSRIKQSSGLLDSNGDLLVKGTMGCPKFPIVRHFRIMYNYGLKRRQNISTVLCEKQ